MNALAELCVAVALVQASQADELATHDLQEICHAPPLQE
jgi:hypothetical protein